MDENSLIAHRKTGVPARADAPDDISGSRCERCDAERGKRMRRLDSAIRLRCALFLATAVLLSWGNFAAALPKRRVLGPERRLRTSEKSGRAIIAVDCAAVVRGQPFTLSVEFHTGSGGRFYNPDLIGGQHVPADLVIFDSKTRYVGEKLRFVRGSRHGVTAASWVHLAPLSYCARAHELTIDIGWCGSPPKYQRLPAGKYYLQLIYDASFVSEPNAGDPESPIEANGELDKIIAGTRDLFRSNILEIELVDRSPSERPKPAQAAGTPRALRVPFPPPFGPDPRPASNGFGFRPQFDVSDGATDCGATLASHRTRVARGGAMTVDIRVTNYLGGHGVGLLLYNPFMDPRLPPPAELAIFDRDLHYIGNVAPRQSPLRKPNRDDWIRTMGYVGTKLTIRPTIVPGTEWKQGHELPPGRYYLQLICNSRLACGVTWPPDDEQIQRCADPPLETDVFRSNAMPIEIVEREPDSATARPRPGG